MDISFCMYLTDKRFEGGAGGGGGKRAFTVLVIGIPRIEKLFSYFSRKIQHKELVTYRCSSLGMVANALAGKYVIAFDGKIL